MRPENRYGQMTPSERVAFALSEEGKNYLFPWGFTVDGKRYENMVPGRVARVFDEESRRPFSANWWSDVGMIEARY